MKVWLVVGPGNCVVAKLHTAEAARRECYIRNSRSNGATFRSVQVKS